MSLENIINDDIKKAMLDKDSQRLNALRAVKSAILLAKTEKGGNDGLTSDAEIQILQKLVKQRRDSYDIYVSQQRQDLAEEEKLQIDVISSYLPAQLSDEELMQAVKEVVAELGATGPADMGKVMGIASKRLSGKAEGKRISAAVKSLLSA
ncbi:MAG: GatB/YqeY domain-containing protein [Candidatus Competibacteraceae bacterium]|nr:GatB/YqeY domain-containing protein [Candidatus Competibacteraceae bacterium]